MHKLMDILRGLLPGQNSVSSDLFDVTPSYPPIPVPTAAFFASLIRVKDGDTQEFWLNKHHGSKLRITLRLLGVDTREVTGKEKLLGLSDKEYVVEWLRFGLANSNTEEAFVVQTVATDKYGRWLGWLWRICDGACLNIDLVTTGHYDPGPGSAHQMLMMDVMETARELEH